MLDYARYYNMALLASAKLARTNRWRMPFDPLATAPGSDFVLSRMKERIMKLPALLLGMIGISLVLSC